jgi:hypothetical protein
MSLPPGLRKLALTVHVATTVGWLGAVACFLALAIVGLASQDAQTVRAVYLVSEPIALLVLVPLAVASLLTGTVQSLGTRWGLFQHYWVVFKFVITIIAAAVLLSYTRTISQVADAAAVAGVDPSQLRNTSFILHSAGGLLALAAATVLAVYKPPGMTRYGRRKSLVPIRRPHPPA